MAKSSMLQFDLTMGGHIVGYFLKQSRALLSFCMSLYFCLPF